MGPKEPLSSGLSAKNLGGFVARGLCLGLGLGLGSGLGLCLGGDMKPGYAKQVGIAQDAHRGKPPPFIVAWRGDGVLSFLSCAIYPLVFRQI